MKNGKVGNSKGKGRGIGTYCVVILFVGMIIGLLFVSGVYFNSAINNIFVYYIPSFLFIVAVFSGLMAFRRMYRNQEVINLFLTHIGSLNKFPKLWPLHLLITTLFVAVTLGPLVSFALWNNAKLLSKVLSHQPIEKLVVLESLTVNNYRRRNMLQVVLQSEHMAEPIKLDVKRKDLQFQQYGRIVNSIRVNKRVCITGYKAAWGLVINRISAPSNCSHKEATFNWFPSLARDK